MKTPALFIAFTLALFLAIPASAQQEFHKVGPSKTFKALTITQSTLAFLDMHQTMHSKSTYGPYFREYDPLAAPFTRLPTPAYYSIGAAGTASVALLSYKMRHSTKRWERRLWWTPLAIQIAGNSYGIAASHQVW